MYVNDRYKVATYMCHFNIIISLIAISMCQPYQIGRVTKVCGYRVAFIQKSPTKKSKRICYSDIHKFNHPLHSHTNADVGL